MLYKIGSDQKKNRILQKIKSSGNDNLNQCLQCYKCGGMCQKSDKFDYTPRQILEQIIDGLEESILNSRAIWICETCNECKIDCPVAINFKKIMASLREIAREEGIEPNTEEVNRKFVKKAHCPKKEDD
ncbi:MULTISPECIES: 4Fe-4S dicluster domain-containing protein [unclassified Candidatus Frackibacter]|jgi:heterodisulfide reductase subunit C|uniref:4Fe-4S dicluster domain-containing protein n=1 Tax=unclassified Candidatus Frackibacter TaxID=2648818 RepID=UPI000887E116|nr:MULTISPECIES: 4Fe-4S dicluster domain-containing protein [unclassified Candidatus Frackibacter]SDC20758.1 heterodisulfide reductase subunit C [Candidatus Frackibacter sp. WG11]SEM50976.1 heterodisulfide reductase subunit C [Candidatus Frackibacter sp. WG12]SFL52290.1 heterodisulfide reductase subunit C [Candidatus Frackibacter sp. WG13]